MNRLIVIVTGLHVLAHSIFGCCDHVFAASSDTSTDHECSHAVARDVEPSRHKHDCHDAVADPRNESELSSTYESNGESAPHQRHDCRHADCHWLTSLKAAAASLLDYDCTPAGAARIAEPLALTPLFGLSPERDIRRCQALPLRLHLAFGVLLI